MGKVIQEPIKNKKPIEITGILLFLLFVNDYANKIAVI
jgi:hypothetical protein